jgi:hypothetical protein
VVFGGKRVEVDVAILEAGDGDEEVLCFLRGRRSGVENGGEGAEVEGVYVEAMKEPWLGSTFGGGVVDWEGLG